MILSSIPFFLQELPWYLFYLALGVTGIACLRLSKRGADNIFIIAAWLAMTYVALIGTAWILGWATSFLPGWRMWVARSYGYFLTVSYILYFGHLLAFAVAAFRTAARLPAGHRQSKEHENLLTEESGQEGYDHKGRRGGTTVGPTIPYRSLEASPGQVEIFRLVPQKKGMTRLHFVEVKPAKQ